MTFNHLMEAFILIFLYVMVHSVRLTKRRYLPRLYFVIMFALLLWEQHRASWLGFAGAFAVFLVGCSLRSKILTLARIGLPSAVGLGVMYLMLWAAVPDYTRELTSRMGDSARSFFQSDMYDTEAFDRHEFSSTARRWKESELAWEFFRQDPILGTGLGFKFWHLKYPLRQGQYLHNGWFWLLMKTGLMGLLPFLWLCFSFWYHAARYFKSVRDSVHRAFVFGFGYFYVVVVLATIAEPRFFTPAGGATIGVLWGTTGAIVQRWRGVKRVASALKVGGNSSMGPP